MTMNRTGRYHRQDKIAQTLKTMGVLVTLAALGYIGIGVAQHALPLLNAAAGFALESQMVNPETVNATQNEQLSVGTARAAVPVENASRQPFDYFPDHYVNKATEVEEQPPTF